MSRLTTHHEMLGKLFAAARGVQNGTYRSQRIAADALHIEGLQGRISDATTILKEGSPEIIAAAESGAIGLQTARTVAIQVPRAEQAQWLANFYPTEGSALRHGLYIDKKKHLHGVGVEVRRTKQVGVIDKLITALGDRAEALAICSEGELNPGDDKAHGWRQQLRHVRDVLREFERKIKSKSESKQNGDTGSNGNSNDTHEDRR